MDSKSESTKPRAKKSTGKAGRRVDMGELAPLTQAISLKNIGTVRFSAEALRPAFGVLETDISQRIRFRGTRMPQSEENILLSWIEFEYKASYEDEDIVNIDGALALLYSLRQNEETEFSDQQLDLVAEVNGLFNGWPYVRELISSSMARLGMPHLVLPTFRIPSILPPKGEFNELTTAPVARRKVNAT